MPRCQATRRAAARSSIVQHPPYVVSAPVRLSYICIDRPTTSWPCALRMYAAVEESTPPDIATAIFTDIVNCGGDALIPAQRHPERTEGCQNAAPSPPGSFVVFASQDDVI